MDFFPKQPGLERPKLVWGITFALFQVAITVVFTVAFSFFTKSSSSGSLAAIIVSSMTFGQWCALKTPGSLDRNSFMARLALTATAVQMILGFILLVLIYKFGGNESGETLPPLAFVAKVFPAALVVHFLLTWVGLWSGRSAARRVIIKHQSKNIPSV